MIRSMTGYSSVRRELPDLRLSLNLKTLNHRAIDIRFHSSRNLAMLEIPVRERLQSRMSRGRIEVQLRGETVLDTEVQITPNPELARRYADAAAQIGQTAPELAGASIEYLLGLPGVLDIAEPEIDCERLREPVLALLDEAIEQTVNMRDDEGANLKIELSRILSRIETSNTDIERRRPQVLAEYRSKLHERIEQWSLQIDVEEQRVAQEIAFLSDRSDIQEETARLASHLEQFRTMLENNATHDYEPVGRRLDFLCQEMFREINTMGSKSQDVQITQDVLELKSCVDQLREQVQNVE